MRAHANVDCDQLPRCMSIHKVFPFFVLTVFFFFFFLFKTPPPQGLKSNNRQLILKGIKLQVKVNGGVTGTQAKPDADWNGEQETLTWTLGDITIGLDGESIGLNKVLARMAVKQQSTPSTVSATFQIEDLLLSNASLQAGTDLDAALVSLKEPIISLQTGTYIAA